MKTSHSRLSPMCCIPCPSVIDLIIPIFGEYKLCGYLMQVPSACCCFIPIGSDILSILFSNTFSLCCFLHVRDQLSHSYRTTIFYILIYIIRWNVKRQLQNEWQQAFAKLSLILIFFTYALLIC
jgi:hypothetical protein